MKRGSYTLTDEQHEGIEREAKRRGLIKEIDAKTGEVHFMSHKQVEKYCPLDSASEMMLKQAMTELGLSARAHDKVCKVARTIADLAGAEDIHASASR